MSRSVLFLALLAAGCGGTAPPPPVAPAPSEKSDTAASAALATIRPAATFKLPGPRGSDKVPLVSADGRRVAVTVSLTPAKLVAQVWELAGGPKLAAEFDGTALALSP